MKSANPRFLGLLAVVGIASLMAAGCSTTSSNHASTSEPVINRPLVDQTAVEASASDGSALAFFDDLENRPLASQDDAINACLLLGTGSTAPTYEQRRGMAARLGYIPKDFDRPARQAVTMGEVSVMSIKLLEGRSLSQEDALSKLMQRGIAPASARYNQGLTGAQMVSITGGLRDAMRIEGVRRVAAPSVPEPVKATVATPAAPKAAQAETANVPTPPEAALSTDGVALGEASKEQGKAGVAASVKGSAAPAQAPAGATASAPPATATGAKGHAEPLPKIPPGTVPPAIDLQDPKAKPSVIGPDEKVITPGQPKGAAKPAVISPAPAPKVEDKPKAEPAPEPKPQAQAEPGAAPTMEPMPGAGTPPVKKTAAKRWVSGQPIRKTASAEEGK